MADSADQHSPLEWPSSRPIKLDLAATTPLPAVSVSQEDHPLAVKANVVIVTTSSDKAVESPKALSVEDKIDPSLDPLGAALAAATSRQTEPEAFVDPLSAHLASYNSSSQSGRGGSGGSSSSRDDDSEFMSNFVPWAAKKGSILAKYTTSSRVNFITSFLSSQDDPAVDRTQARLDSLSDPDSMLQTRRDLTQQEYTKHIDFLHQQLVSSWAADQRVTSLKIAIQNAKTMTNTEVLQFYPSKFVLSTEILDTFGKLVYERILERSGRPSVDAPPSSDPQAFERNESAKEMCKNWFYKIASIRELIPRMYIEMALLACYRFLSLTEYDTALERLAKMCRGIGDPLIAAYCRAYICRKGMEVSPKLRKHLYIVFEDFCTSFSQLTPDRLQHILRECELSFSEYLALFVPALEWILQCLSHRSSDDTLNTILHWYERCNNSLVLDAVMTSFDPKYVSDNALRFADLIKKADGLGCPQHQLYMSFGLSLVLSYPDKAVLRRILRDHWKVIVQLENPDDFLRCADVYIEIPAKHFTAADVDHLLGDIVRRVGELPTSTVSTGAGSPGAIAAAAAAAAPIVSGAASPTAGAAAPISTLTLEQALPRLQSILDKILTHLRNFSDLFEMRHFLPMVDLFQTDLVIRNEVCKSILTRFAYPGSTSLFVSAVDRSEVLAEATQLLTDLPRVNTMMYFAKSLHDSVNIMTVDDERRQITELILAFVRRVDYGRDFEQQLSFYVDARANFVNLDGVLIHLVYAACSLIQSTFKLMLQRSKRAGGALDAPADDAFEAALASAVHNRRTSPFVRAACGFCFVTIPSITSFRHRLLAYLLCAEVAMQNACVGQAESFMLETTRLIADAANLTEQETPHHSDEWLVSYIANVASFLIGLPGSPDQGPFFILRQFLEALESYPWNNTSDGKAWCFLSIMKALSHLRTNRSRFNYLGVIPNSVLYDSDDRYEAEVDSLLDIIAEQVTAHLADLKREDSSHAAARRATLSLHLSHILNDYFSCTEATGAMALLQSARANLRETSSHLPTSLHALFRSDPSVVS